LIERKRGSTITSRIGEKSREVGKDFANLYKVPRKYRRNRSTIFPHKGERACEEVKARDNEKKG